MKVETIVFSPTGGTLKVAERLAAALGGRGAVTVDLSDRSVDFSAVRLDPDALVVLAVPSYGGRVPALAAGRLAQVKGGGARCVLVCVYGNRAYEDTLVELEDLAVACGLRPVAAVAAVAEHSIARQFAAGRPDAADNAALDGFGAKILAALASGAPAVPALPGTRPYKKAGGGPTPAAGKKCTGCGRCAALCPAGAIDPRKPNTTDAKRCIGCMRCVAVCPVHARAVNPLVLAGVTAMLKPVCTDRKENELFLA